MLERIAISMGGLGKQPNELAFMGYAESASAQRVHHASASLTRVNRAWLSPRTPLSVGSSKAAGTPGRGSTRGGATPVIAYTDGACSGNPGPGGWAWAVAGADFATGAEAHTTNQRMEMTAAYQAVLAHPEAIEVVSDSTYVVNCFKQRWWEGWLKRGWINSQRRPVANRDLWEPFIELVRTRGNVSFRWVKGHSEDRMNQFVDQLAVEASQTQRPRSGRCP